MGVRRWSWPVAVALTVGLMIPWVAGAAPQAPVWQSWTETDKVVAADYFYWYNVYTGQHFHDPDDTDALTDHPPDAYLGNYSFTEVAWHRRELQDMMAAGIDVVLPVYWGSTAEAYWAKPGLQNLVTAIEGLIADGESPPKVGMFYDTTAILQQNGNQPADLTTQAGKDLFYGMMRSFYQVVPKSMWALIDGRVLTVLYVATDYVSAYDQSTFDYASDRLFADFAVRPYFVREITWEGVTTDGMYPWGVALYGAAVNEGVGSLGPGYDETNVYGRSDPRSRDRECGEFYRAGWEEMAASDAHLVLIETWNEYHEATDIAASREYGRQYIDLTAEGIALWKASKTPQQAAWLSLGTSPYGEGLRPAFNYPDGAWLVTRLAGREAAYPDRSTDPTSYHIFLDVADSFLNTTPAEVWVTVEYYDGPAGDRWFLQYDGVGDPHTLSEPVTLEGSGRWKTCTFHLTDALFSGREARGADMRLVDGYDESTNYFGRVWVFSTAPTNLAPTLLPLQDTFAAAGEVTTLEIDAVDADGGNLSLLLARSAPFAVLTDGGDGQGKLTLAPTVSDLRACPYRLAVQATDDGNPPLSDLAPFRLTVVASDYRAHLPLVACR